MFEVWFEWVGRSKRESFPEEKSNEYEEEYGLILYFELITQHSQFDILKYLLLLRLGFNIHAVIVKYI